MQECTHRKQQYLNSDNLARHATRILLRKRLEPEAKIVSFKKYPIINDVLSKLVQISVPHRWGCGRRQIFWFFGKNNYFNIWITFCMFLETVERTINYYTRFITPERVTSLRGPSPRYCARTIQFLLKKRCSSGESLATLCKIWPVRDLNLKHPAPKANALPLDQLAIRKTKFWVKKVHR